MNLIYDSRYLFTEVLHPQTKLNKTILSEEIAV